MENIIENNKLIAEFLGGIKQPFELPQFGYINSMGDWKDTFFDNQLKFHSNWSWLMEVVEKIESLNFVVQIHLNSCFIKESEHFINNKAIWRGKNHAKTKIEAVYNACIEFIKWYNSHLCANCGIFHNITGVNDLLNMCINKKVL